MQSRESWGGLRIKAREPPRDGLAFLSLGLFKDNGWRRPVDPDCTYVSIQNILQEPPIKMAGAGPHSKSGGLVLWRCGSVGH